MKTLLIKNSIIVVSLVSIIGLTACERNKDTVHTSETVHTTETLVVPVPVPASESASSVSSAVT